ncbi:MAG: helix-turn-helix transcriptional regulator, partial [Nanoarchaeota archaeon]
MKQLMKRRRQKQPYFLTKEARDKLKTVIYQSEMTQKEVAVKLGMPPGTLSARFNATISIGRDQAETLYDALGKPTSLA